jgi:uncharacterized protein (TIGR02145 family)
MKTNRFLALAASILLVMAFTFSCSSDDNNNTDPNLNPSSNNNADSSSDPDNNITTSSSSGTGGSSSSSNGSNSIYVGNSGTFKDTRSNTNYKWVRIGTQIWMAENLNYATFAGSRCYEGVTDNCNKYGMLYDWVAAMEFLSSCYSASCSDKVGAKHKGVCPTGWHLPDGDEWYLLFETVGETSAGTKLKATSDWTNSSGYIPGTNNYGFLALPGGQALFTNVSSPPASSLKGTNGSWWTAKEASAGFAYTISMAYNKAVVESKNVNKSNYYSVRCLAD